MPSTSTTRGARPGRRAARTLQPPGDLPTVPLWFVCTRSHWRRCQQQRVIRSSDSRAPKPGGLSVSLHGGVSEFALAAFGACRTDLVVIAIDPRKLPGSGPDTRVRVVLEDAGRVAIWIDCISLALDAASTVEPLRPLDDEAGYFPPQLETEADRDRRRSRDGLRRTR